MQVHSLEIDYFEGLNHTLICIHTSLPDYKLAYLLNEKLGVRLERSKDAILKKEGVITSEYSVYNYENSGQFIKWFLVTNKHKSKLNTPISVGLFEKANESLNKISYLVPEKRQSDYFIKIEGDYSDTSIFDTIQKIKDISQVVTCYTADISSLKSKEFLIL
jgi:hypothetical protein